MFHVMLKCRKYWLARISKSRKSKCWAKRPKFDVNGVNFGPIWDVKRCANDDEKGRQATSEACCDANHPKWIKNNKGKCCLPVSGIQDRNGAITMWILNSERCNVAVIPSIRKWSQNICIANPQLENETKKCC